jgi:predicted Zn-dependent protease
MKMTTIGSVLAVLLLGATPGFAGWDEGVAAFKAGNYSQAAREFQALVEERTDCAQCYVMLGQSLLKLNRAGEAATQLRKAYDMNPNDDATKLVLAQAYLQANKNQEAAQLLKTVDANSLSGARQQAFYQMRAAALERSGQGDQALADLRSAARSSPNNASAQYAYGTAALAARDLGSAIPALEAAARLDAGSADKKRSLLKAYLLQGRQAQGGAKTAAYGKAVETGRALVASQANFDNLMLLGEAQLGAKQYRDAAGTFERAHRANGNDWLALYYMGQAQTIAGDFGAAEQNLKTALTKTSSTQDQNRIWKQLGFVYEKQRNFEEAKSAYRRVGDAGGIARVERNEQIATENQDIEEYNRQVEEIERQRRELEEEMGAEQPPNFF